jgi:aromatic ring-opening dioxygenase catalytic subunit (LigB family)
MTGPKLILFSSTHYMTDFEAYHLAKRRRSHTYMTLDLYIYHLNYTSYGGLWRLITY